MPFLRRSFLCSKYLYSYLQYASCNHQTNTFLLASNGLPNYYVFNADLIPLRNTIFYRKFSTALSTNAEQFIDSTKYDDNEKSKLTIMQEFKAGRNLTIDNYIDIKMYLILEFGMDPRIVADLAKDLPDLHLLEVEEVNFFLGMLLSFSFNRHQIKQMISSHPWLLLIPPQRVEDNLSGILQRIDISRAQLPELCVNAPCVLADFNSAEETSSKYAYFYYELSYRDLASIIETGVFNFSLDYIKQRFVFLYRRGQFILPTKSDLSQDLKNPSLADVFLTSEEKYCSSVARCDRSEFELFKKFFAKECNLREKIIEAQNRTIKVYNKEVISEDFVDEDIDDKKGLADELVKYL